MRQPVCHDIILQMATMIIVTSFQTFFQVAAPEIAMIKIAAPNMAQTVTDRAIQVN